jgi:chromosome transmission fidelity protein 1
LTDILTDNILNEPLDIEELASLSGRMKICGYYAARQAAPLADILITPYQSILSESARASLGISLLNKIIVFDEAHNLMESVAALNSAIVPYSSFYLGFSQIEAYLRKYESRLSPKNAKFLRDISAICADFSKYLKLKW